MLTLTRTTAGMVFGTAVVNVRRATPIPAIGARPPRIHTDTVVSAHGDLGAIDTHQPHDDLHRVDFADVIGKRPVALLSATPLLCQSRTCGPVTDLALQLSKQYGNKVTFIHEEVYKNDQVNQGLRPQLEPFHLQTDPWLFTFDRKGRVAARLEGAFGLRAFRQAVEAALR